MRSIYCESNNCLPNKILAETSEFYITLDVMLEKKYGAIGKRSYYVIQILFTSLDLFIILSLQCNENSIIIDIMILLIIKWNYFYIFQFQIYVIYKVILFVFQQIISSMLLEKIYYLCFSICSVTDKDLG